MFSKWMVTPLLLIAITASVWFCYGDKRYSNYHLTPLASFPDSIEGLKRTWFYCERCLKGGRCDAEDITQCKAVTLPEKNEALNIAAGRANIEAVTFLVEVAKADVNFKSKDYQETPLMAAAYYGTKNHEKIATFLLSHGANINAVSNTPPIETALLTAIWKNHLEFTRFLLKNGADPSVTSKGKKDGDACITAIVYHRPDFFPVIPECCSFIKNNPERVKGMKYECPQ
ncbi:ankyrin repeat domain-containing protein [Scandinavium sp. NPDC088450]|uniref:ankyrin repeat domain-containing protein n=1 Tax=Scandinavium sp. NPDC088450 TaxID=3364514 RepID=UPI00384A693E